MSSYGLLTAELANELERRAKYIAVTRGRNTPFDHGGGMFSDDWRAEVAGLYICYMPFYQLTIQACSGAHVFSSDPRAFSRDHRLYADQWLCADRVLPALRQEMVLDDLAGVASSDVESSSPVQSDPLAAYRIP